MTIKKRGLWIGLGVAACLLMVLLSLNHFYVDYLWFDEAGYTEIFFKELITKLQLGIPIFIVLSVIMFFFIRFLKGKIGLTIGDNKTKKSWITFFYALLVLGVSLLMTVFVINRIWYEFLEFTNQTVFNVTDPIFNKDLGFYIYTVPFLESLYNIIRFFYTGLALIVLVAYGYLSLKNHFDLSNQQNLEDLKNNSGRFIKDLITNNIKLVGILLGIFLILLVPQYIFEAFDLLYSSSGIVVGAGASDVDVGLKVVIIKAVLAFAMGLMVIWAGYQKKFRLLLSGPVVLIVITVVGTLGQAAYESLIVVPNQLVKEEAYIAYNINFTQTAYDLLEVEVVEFSGDQTLTAEDIAENEITIENIPINDQDPTQDMYNSLQGIRNYYQFYDVDVDRYMIDDEYTQVFLGAREMNNDLLPDEAKTWVNQHLKYTHGFGLAMSPVNKTTATGQPELIIKDIPPSSEYSELTIEEPRIYFGESDDDYIITNCTTAEFDYPQGENNQETIYSGSAGINMSFFNRLSFALYYGSPELLLANEITSDSKMIFRRNLIDRISTIAPFLSYDSDPYLVVADGRLYWIIDAFTSSDRYPYSQSFNEAGDNYVRNSVKVVVDAYNGDVTFYQVEDEPLIDTFGNIYSEWLTDLSEMPESIRIHTRYSKTLFDIQSEIYKTYHMSNPQVFYNKEDQWETATQFYETEKSEVLLPSSYIMMKLPEREEEFMLTTTFTPKNKDNMNAWLAGVSDGEDYGKLILYQFPKQQLIYGPMQIEQRIDQDTTISPQLTLLSQQGSRVLRGNMMPIPIENAIVYVEPVYIQASSGDNNLPEVKKVILSYQDRMIMADSLGEGIEQLFGVTSDGQPEESSSVQQDGNVSTSLVSQANALFDEAQAAQQAGDWALYGQKLDELEAVLKNMQNQTTE
ncbi:UPF0182 family protein [Eubacteriaceae bacterium ES3]|nr:UPF0182 family protein [Eubacteriaceae bacterium ES3]